MADVSITGAPNGKITITGYERAGNKYTITFTVDKTAVSGENARRFQKFYCYIRVGEVNANTASTLNTSQYCLNAVVTLAAKSDTTTYTCSGSLDESKTYPRDPYNLRAKYLAVEISGVNKIAGKTYESNGTRAVKAWNINRPNTVTVGETLSYDNSTNTMSCSVQAPAYVLASPRTQVSVRVWRETFIGGVVTENKLVYQGTPIGRDDTHDGEAYTYTVTEKDSVSLTGVDDYVKWNIQAQCQGYNGANPNSADAKYTGTDFAPNKVDQDGWKCATVFKAYPAKPSLPILTLTDGTPAGGLNVCWDDNWTRKRPTETTKVQLAFATKQSLIQESSWSDVTDDFVNTDRNLKCTGFVPYSKITPAVNEHVYLRILAEGQGRQVASDVVLVNDQWYYTEESPQGDAPANVIQVVSATSGGDNTSIDCVIGYADDAQYNAVELSYSTDQKAWTSTKSPSTYEMRDTYWQDKTSKSSSHDNTSSISICDLNEGTTYFIRARRINLTDTDKHTLWSAVVRGNTTKDEVSGLQLSSVDKVATGKSATFSWEWGSELKQSSWSLINADTGQGFAYGEDGATSTDYAFTKAGTYNVYLHATYSDGTTSDSNTVTLRVVEKPTATITLTSQTMTSVPYTFEVGGSSANCVTTVQVVSPIGCTRSYPDADEVQYGGDVIYSQDFTGTSNTVTLDDATQFFDEGSYQIKATPSVDGIKGETVSENFKVSYTATVQAPSDDDIVVAKDEATKSVQVQVNNLADGVSWRLYRSSTDTRNTLIATDLSSGQVVTDPYAPYSSEGAGQYIVLVENENMQNDQKAVAYTLKGSTLRFDWDSDRSIEVPYNLSISDQTDKQFEQQLYLDGSQRGSWGSSVVRTSSLSTDLIYIKDATTLELIRELSRYQGAVFVRTPLGQAYCADVQVNEISKDYSSKVVAVSFDCTEIDATSEFKAGGTS